MQHAFRLGPLDVAGEGDVFMFAAAGPDGAILGPVLAPGDEEGLRKLRAEAPAESFVCEPELADAAGTMGLPTAPLPQQALAERALLALDFAMWPVVDESNAPELLARIMQASLVLAEAAPWEQWPEGEALEVTVEGVVTGTWEGVVFGPESGLPGFLLYSTPGTVARIAELVKEGKVDEVEALPCIGLLFADGPEYAKQALETVGVWFVPHVHCVAPEGGLAPIADPDLHAVLTVAGALAKLEDGDREAAHEMEGARARVRVPDGVEMSTFDDDLDLGLTYDPEVPPEPEAWLAADEQIRMMACMQFHSRSGVAFGPETNPRLHAILHAILENQIALGEPPRVAATVRRLIAEGLGRHDAIHATSTVVVKFMTDGKVFDEASYNRDLDEVTAEWWLAGGIESDRKPRKN